jgi:DNA-binding Lrp family transcriptional regulator
LKGLLLSKTKSHDLEERIIEILSFRQNSSLRGLAAEIGLSSSWLKKQILKLCRDGTIKSWQVVLHPLSFQERIFFLLLKTNPNEPSVVNDLLNNYDQNSLSTLEGITGEFSLICRFHFNDTTEFLDSLDHIYELIGETGFQKYQMLEVIKVHKEAGMPVPQIRETLRPREQEKLLAIRKLVERSEIPLSTYQLANKLEESQPAVYRRLKKWKDDNVILGYSINTSYWQEKYIHTYIHVKAPLGKYRSIIDFCNKTKHVIQAYRTNQEYSLLLKTRHRNLTSLNNFLKTLYQQVEVEDTLTTIILDTLRSN